MDIAKWCTRIITWSFALLFVLVPFILTSVNYELFEYNKMMITYGLTVIIVGAWFIKIIAQKEIRIRRTPLDIPIALFFGSQLLATIFSMDPHVSWFGYYSRFNGGMFSVASYILLFYAFVSNWSNGTNLSNLVKIILTTALVVALYGLLEHFGYSTSCFLFTGKFDVSCWVQDVQNRVFATLGQPNWLAAYLAALLPISVAFAEFWLWGLVSMVFFAVLLFTKSRSGLMGFAIADAIFWGILLLQSPKKNIFRSPAFRPLVLLHIALLAIIFFTGTNIDMLDRFVTLKGLQMQTSKQQIATPSAQPKTDTLLSTGGTESGEIRKYVWQGAVNAWKSSVKTFFIGTGTETFAFAFYQNKPKAHNLTSEWDFLYNKAHNEYLNYLATTGILGICSYLLLIGAFIFWFLKFSKKEILNAAVFSGWFSILVTNFFGFSVVIMQLFLFLFPAMIMIAGGSMHAFFIRTFRIQSSIAHILHLIILFTAIGLLYVLGRFWVADTDYAKGYQYNRFGKVVEAKNYLTAAIEGNPAEPVYHDEVSLVFAELAVAEIDAHDATTAAILAKKSLQEGDTALTISPKNVNFWKTRVKIFNAFSSFDPTFTNAAIGALQQSRALAPTDPKVTYSFALLYGRQGENKKAIDMLKTTIDLKPNYRDAYALLVILYKDQPSLARATIEEYLKKVDSNDKDFLAQLQQL